MKSEENRHNPFGGIDTVRMNPPSNPAELIKSAGPTDPEISFLSVQSTSGRPIALLANYSLHYVGGIPIGVLSGDYFGVFDQRIGQMLGADRSDPPFVGIMSNGTSGDINNINLRQRGPAMAPYEKMNRVGNAVAAEVFRVYQTLQHHDWVRLDARYDEIPLQPRRPTPEMVAYARKVLERPKGEKLWHTNEHSYARNVLRAVNAPMELRAPLQLFCIGDLAIAATPIETFVEVGLEIKARTPFAKAFTISIANAAFGYMYMPTREQHKLGGYETWLGTNRVEHDAAPKDGDAAAGHDGGNARAFSCAEIFLLFYVNGTGRVLGRWKMEKSSQGFSWLDTSRLRATAVRKRIPQSRRSACPLSWKSLDGFPKK